MQKILITALTLACVTAQIVHAQSPAPTPPPEPPKKWESSAAAGLTLTHGNSESFLATLTLDTKRKWEKDEVAFGVGAGYGDTTVNGDNEKTTEYVRGFGQYNRLFTEKLYAGLRLDGEYDGIAGVQYRFRASPVLGYYIVKKKDTSLAVEAGPSFVLEKLEGTDSDTYVAARFGERFEHKLTPTTKVWESAEYLPSIEEWTEKYLINLEVGIDTAITKSMSLRVVFQDNYDSRPAPGRQNNDYRLIAGVVYKF